MTWEGPDLPEFAFQGERGDLNATATANWSKTLHALDPDLYLLYRAPRSGSYRLRIEPVIDREQPLGEISRDTGLAPLSTPLPARTPAAGDVSMAVALRPAAELQGGDIVLETEPNSTPEQAVAIPFEAGDGDGNSCASSAAPTSSNTTTTPRAEKLPMTGIASSTAARNPKF